MVGSSDPTPQSPHSPSHFSVMRINATSDRSCFAGEIGGDAAAMYGDGMVPLAVILRRQMSWERIEKPGVLYGAASESKKGDDFTFVTTECQRAPGHRDATFSVSALFYGHNGSAAAIYSKENPLNNVLSLHQIFSRNEWIQAFPRALVVGFVKTDKDFKEIDRDYSEADMVEEIFEDGSPVLAQRLDLVYPVCTMFKMFNCAAICQLEMKASEGISVNAGSSRPGKVLPWNGPFLCSTCQTKKEAMEGRRP